MTRRVAGWMLVAAVGCAALPAAHAAERGSRSVTPQAADAASAAAQPAAPPLEGTRWSVAVTPDARSAKRGAKPFNDTLVFQDGKVTMETHVRLGYGASDYAFMPTGEAWSLTTAQVSTDPTRGKRRWEAAFKGDTVTGTLLWMTRRHTNVHYTFEGKKLQPPKQKTW